VVVLGSDAADRPAGRTGSVIFAVVLRLGNACRAAPSTPAREMREKIKAAAGTFPVACGSNCPIGRVEVHNSNTRAMRMTIRLTMATVSLAGLAVLGFHVAGFSETRHLTNDDDALDLSDLTVASRCCSLEDYPLQVRLLEAQRMSGPAGVKDTATLVTAAPDAGTQTSRMDGEANREFGIEANAAVPGVNSGLDAASVAEPPQSALSRLLNSAQVRPRIDDLSAKNLTRAVGCGGVVAFLTRPRRR
jgi:hypothetical protein